MTDYKTLHNLATEHLSKHGSFVQKNFKNEDKLNFTLLEILSNDNNEKHFRMFGSLNNEIHDLDKNIKWEDFNILNLNFNELIHKKNNSKPSLFYKSISAKVKITREKKIKLKNIRIELIKNYTRN